MKAEPQLNDGSEFCFGGWSRSESWDPLPCDDAVSVSAFAATYAKTFNEFDKVRLRYAEAFRKKLEQEERAETSCNCHRDY